MHVGGITVDLNWFIQLIFTLFIIGIGLIHLVKNTASKYFEVGANFEGGEGGAASRIPAHRNHSPLMDSDHLSCANCGNSGNKKCSRCKSVFYCSIKCQEAHWKSGHKTKCKIPVRVSSTDNAKENFGFKASGVVGERVSSGIALVPSRGAFKFLKKPREVLFPYDEFIKLYNWDKEAFSPCGLLNCGNSCFANAVLQCLTFTRPLAAYLLEKGHRRECRRNDWCFLCELQVHVERASKSTQPFSPMSILSRLPNIGGNLGYGKQEDAHEFMRFAIDTMQSVFLDEFGGEKAVDPASQETTLIQHVFGGHLQSQVICTKCNKISNQLENMMDLTVEIHGEAASLEECLDQFTVKEQLHGDNMYRCDGCNDYVKAWKCLTIRRAPNILTIALKRFQSGRFGKLNKRVAFPEMLNLSPYISEAENGTDVYRLYAVVVHVDMLNASFFGHYICYIKDFCGNWYRVDDCKVRSVGLEEVLSQGAYMLLYSRISARPSCLRTMEPSKEQKAAELLELHQSNGKIECTNIRVEGVSDPELMNGTNSNGYQTHEKNFEYVNECEIGSTSAVSIDGSFCVIESSSSRVDSLDMNNVDMSDTQDALAAFSSEAAAKDSESMIAIDSDISLCDPADVSGCGNDSCSAIGSKVVEIEDGGNIDVVNSETSSAVVNDIKVNGNTNSFSSMAASAEPLHLKHQFPFKQL
ncbi:ubiquitin carboxyl-terminal hydrolase 18 isoform X2 [Mercurialis annua]|uniref:ubiquitin carboxyl-terminal hydrolase 18 isoform X2 n=1 Tax=Mercurialis annua TaxID=3986 RepID=UPI002160B70C|nr:ubiquitin carboxyl-terminal hydrolase 18 isoform X2 [Mercurialis annua]